MLSPAQSAMGQNAHQHYSTLQNLPCAGALAQIQLGQALAWSASGSALFLLSLTLALFPLSFSSENTINE
jgi:hypothetical protein